MSCNHEDLEGKFCLNWQEQIEYNKDNIQKIKDYIREHSGKEISQYKFEPLTVDPLGQYVGRISVIHIDGTISNVSYTLNLALSSSQDIIVDVVDDRLTFKLSDTILSRIQSLEYINELIPEQADPGNQLADKEFVNSSIATNTANFRGTYDAENLLPLTGNTPNDYAFVQTTDNEGNTVYKRFKWVDDEWLFEYDLNNSSFTAQQWANINMDHNKYLEKISTAGKVYGTDFSGNQANWSIRTSPDAYSVMFRSNTGTCEVGTPITDRDAATKKYVDDGLSEITSDLDNKLDKVSTANILYGTHNDGHQTTYTWDYNRGQYTIVRRYTNGCVFVGDPTDPWHATTKKYVDNSISGLATEGYVDTKVVGFDTRITNAENAASSAVSAVNNKLDKINAINRIYGTDGSGNQTTFAQSSGVAAWSVALRNQNGQLIAGTPTADDHLTTKKYVDDGLNSKLDKVTSANRIYATGGTGNQTHIAWSNAADADSVVVRLGDGRIKISDPVVWNDGANKNYVDNAIDGLSTVATSGSYNDLSDKPTIPQFSHLYRHDIYMTCGNVSPYTAINITILDGNSVNTTYNTYSKLRTWLYNNNYTGSTTNYPCTGGNLGQPAIGLYASSTGNIYCGRANANAAPSFGVLSASNTWTIIERVTILL